MAGVVTLHEPLPQLMQRKIFKATEDLAFEMGLRSRHMISGEQMIGPGMIIQLALPKKEAPPSGYLFNSVNDDPTTGERLARPTEQIEIRGNSIIYRTWQYISQDWNFARMNNLFAPFLQAAADNVAIQNTRVEYADRFIWSDNAMPPDFTKLIRPDCPVIAPMAYSSKHHWHSHSGQMLSDANGVQRVSFANFDTGDVDQNGEMFPSVAIMTAMEDRHSLDAEPISTDIVHTTFNEMHDKLNQSLASIITDQLAERIYLKD